jgi:glycine hydroxymethyltransferase
MRKDNEYFISQEKELLKAAEIQDEYDLNTINLIAPASPTPLKYFHNTHLRHNAIAEGLLGHRPYAGVEGFNKIEQIAADLACNLFCAEHANVQPHSVSQANQAVYQALLENGDPVLAMKFHDGGHLTHGLKQNFSGRFFNFDFYGVDEKTGLLNYDEIRQRALELRPKMIVCGASSYPRTIDFENLASICKETGSYLMADLSHPAGLIVAERFPQPFPHCDVTTLTLDKTMLGPHGGIILCKEQVAEKIDKAVHPGVQSSVPLRRIYEMALCMIDAGKPEFKDYIDRVINNMKIFEGEFNKYPNLLVTGGSDTHLMVLNTYQAFGLTGKNSEELLEKIGILTNRQVVPGEKLKPYVASGIRLGTAWITARGYSESETKLIANVILDNLKDPNNASLQDSSKINLEKLLKIRREKDVWDKEMDK